MRYTLFKPLNKTVAILLQHIIAVIGIGSPFGKDQLGWQVINQLQNKQSQNNDIDLIVEDRPGLNLLNRMQGYNRVILVDALIGENQNDDVIHQLNKQQIISLSQPTISSHAAGVAETIALGEAVGQLPNELLLVGAEVSKLNIQPTFKLVQQVSNKVEQLLKKRKYRVKHLDRA